MGKRVWFCAVFFGLIGQIAWIVENMYFATFAQDVFSNSGRADMSYIVTTLMVILSALTATITTVAAGAMCDRRGKRAVYIGVGYIAWGITIMLFALIPMNVSKYNVWLVAILIILFDCIMTVAGSTSNDGAFNAWVADNTDPSNRGRVNSVLSVLSVFAVVIVFIGLGGLYNAENESNSLFFVIVGAIPLLSGILALFVLKDSTKLKKNSSGELLYGFRISSIKANSKLYICLLAACVIGIAQQTFFSYLINFLCITLKLGDGFVIPMAVIILCSAAFTGVTGVLADKLGRRNFYIPLLIFTVIGIISFWLLKFTDGLLKMVTVYVGGTIMMGGILSLTALFMATFQDSIPSGYEGRYQGVRMCAIVLVPMIIGPVISLMLGMDAMGINGADFVPPYSMFLAAAVVAAVAVIPIMILRKEKTC